MRPLVGMFSLVLVACTPHPRMRATAPRPSALEIETDRGVVIGRERNGVREFFDIPYAAPPVGALRWRAPAPAAAWASPRDATHRGYACPQPEAGFHRDTSEDCLNLNVWVPDGSTKASRTNKLGFAVRGRTTRWIRRSGAASRTNKLGFAVRGRTTRWIRRSGADDRRLVRCKAAYAGAAREQTGAFRGELGG